MERSHCETCTISIEDPTQKLHQKVIDSLHIYSSDLFCKVINPKAPVLYQKDTILASSIVSYINAPCKQTEHILYWS